MSGSRRPAGGEGDEGERHVLRVGEEEAGERLDRLLGDRLPLSRTRAAELIEAGHTTVEGEEVSKSHRPAAGDRVEVFVPPPEPIDLEPEPLPVEVLYEDEDLAVVDKPAGMVVHPAPGHPDGTLVNALLHRLGGLSSLGTPDRPGIVHRLDKDTSGVLVVAKTDEAHRSLSRDLARREVGRGYVAASWGHVDEARFTLDRPVGRSPSDRKRMSVVEEGKRAVTHVRRLERWRSADLLAVKLETGRTHQIRVHLSDIGHPVVGDPLYAPDWHRGFTGTGGRWAEEMSRRCERMFLHASRLRFRHPRTGERMTFDAPLPDRLAEVVTWARETA